ncbi:MAG: glycosyltransferase [Bacteroidales bacterium]
MNILILQTKAFPHRENSFYWFYAQLTEWLTDHGIPSKLYFSYLQIDDKEFDNGLLLPDLKPDFYSVRNLNLLCDYIQAKKIDLILDYSHVITGNTRKFMLAIKKRNPHLKIFTMIHNCPSHTTQLKNYELSTMTLSQVKTPKKLIQWGMPRLYLFLLKKVVKYQNRSAYDTLDEVVLLSPAYLPEFRKLIGISDASRLSAIPNAIRPVESQIPIDKKNKEIIFVGRMAPEKALPKLLKIWEIIQHLLPDWKLTLVGDGPTRPLCEKIIRKRKLERIEMIGHQMSIPYIDRARILCLTSVIEGLPTVFTEAMSLGVIPVGFDSFNAIHDIIKDGENGFIVPEDDYQKYASVLVGLAQNDALRQRIARKAQLQKGCYDIQKIGPLWVETFKKHGLTR